MALSFNDTDNGRLRTILLIVFIAASIVLMSVYAVEGSGGFLHSMQAEVQSVIAPLKAGGNRAGASADGLLTSLGDATADGDTLSSLKEQNKELRGLLAQSEEYKQEAERLRNLVELKDTYSIDGVSGRVIGRSSDAWNQTITLDVGSDDGVAQGLTVIGSSGVVGQVISVAKGSCTVRLITDPASGVAAMVQSSRAEGIVRGSLSGLLYLENVPIDVNVDIGDVVITSGLGGSYTKGLLIGSVVRVNNQVGSDLRTIVVSQNEDISHIEEAIVVFSAEEAKAQIIDSSDPGNGQAGSEGSGESGSGAGVNGNSIGGNASSGASNASGIGAEGSNTSTASNTSASNTTASNAGEEVG